MAVGILSRNFFSVNRQFCPVAIPIHIYIEIISVGTDDFHATSPSIWICKIWAWIFIKSAGPIFSLSDIIYSKSADSIFFLKYPIKIKIKERIYN